MLNHFHVTRAAIVGDGIRDAGLRQGAVVYLVWDERAARLFVVQWDRVAWRCSCHNTTACPHKMAVNDYAVEQRATSEDLAPHLEDEARTPRSKADAVVERVRNMPTPARQQEDW